MPDRTVPEPDQIPVSDHSMLTEAASSAIAAPTAPAATPMEPEQDFPTPATPGSEIEQKYVPMSTASSSLRQGSFILLNN